MLSNADIKRLCKLKERSGRQEQKKFLIEGKRSVFEALSRNKSSRENRADLGMLIVNAEVEHKNFSEIYSIADGTRIEEIPAAKFKKLSTTETSQGIVAVAEMHEFSHEDLLGQICTMKKAVVLILDRISDPGNLGTVLRSAEWFGVDAVLISKGSVDIYNPKVVRSAMAAIIGLNVLQIGNIATAKSAVEEEISILKSHDFVVIGSCQNAKINCTDYSFPEKIALVFGSEASGIDEKILSLCNAVVMIPRIGKMESLNVGVAASIILAEVVRQRYKGSKNL